jgi:NTE family protein
MPILKRPRISHPTVIAPQKLLPLDWIIDYETANHQALFAMGKMDAEKALMARMGA